MANSEKPIRMCFVCRGRFEQNLLSRLQCKEKKLQSFDGFGRSFYLCKECLDKIHEGVDIKRIEKALFRECKNKDNYLEQLKEMLTYVR